MRHNLVSDLLLSLSFSFFGLLLVFGLGFVFPEINPYVAIKWIVIVCAVPFFYSFFSFVFVKTSEIIAWRQGLKKEVKSAAKKPAKKKTSKK
ncbi:MAG: hypothetical protein ACD_13C00181G0002 [uncultured bacterium]|nr:MAG: hypothetical protein ACD_13C00181G0002 [uncultured bacterium]